MAGDVQVGSVGLVRVRITAVDDVANSCSLRMIDNNGNFITAQVTGIAQSLVEITGVPMVALNDVLECISTTESVPVGVTVVVRWVDNTNPADVRWSPAEDGSPEFGLGGWKKEGTATLS